MNRKSYIIYHLEWCSWSFLTLYLKNKVMYRQKHSCGFLLPFCLHCSQWILNQGWSVIWLCYLAFVQIFLQWNSDPFVHNLYYVWPLRSQSSREQENQFCTYLAASYCANNWPEGMSNLSSSSVSFVLFRIKTCTWGHVGLLAKLAKITQKLRFVPSWGLVS